MWRRRWACRWVCRRDARRGRAKGPVQAFPEGAIASLPGKIRKGESLNKKALRVSAFFVQRASATLWLARGRELPALVRVAVPRLLALVLLLFTALRLLADLAEAALVLAERLEALPRLVAELAEAAFSRLPVVVVALALLRVVVLRVLVLAAALRERLVVSARATVVLPL